MRETRLVAGVDVALVTLPSVPAVTTVTAPLDRLGPTPLRAEIVVVTKFGASLEREAPRARAREVVAGAVARVESNSGATWSAVVRYVSGDTIGLRGASVIDSRIAERDIVTMTVGHDESLVAAQARVLSASGQSMRLLRKESFDGVERNRRAVRVPVSLVASIESVDGRLDTTDATIVDLSSVGCAIVSTSPALIGTALTIVTHLDSALLEVSGTVVRTWIGPDDRPAMGINFDLVAAETERLITRYLIATLRHVVVPRQ